MKVEISPHAAEQIAARKLSQATVIRVAESPEQTVEREGELPVAQSRITFGEKPALLRVAYKDVGEIRLVVTAYPTTKIDKYWQADK